ncbi:MAG: DUF560 domain-containing protein [Gammaproteobacteria bacterium]|nr:DUF560 domain-containing protein [Gammaproteobacteria bacterium]
MAKMEALIRNGQAETAYTQMLPFEFERAGEPDFDYLLGLAALENGHPDKATLAFERVLSVDSSMLGARLDMARAYFMLGNFDLAKQEFEELQSMNPPPEAEKAINKYLSAIENRPEEYGGSLFVEFTVGHDTNINAATDSADLYVDALGGIVVLNSDDIETSDSFMQMRLAGEAINRLSQKTSIYGTLDIKARGHSNEQDYDNLRAALKAGINNQIASGTLRLGISYSDILLDSEAYGDVLGIYTQFRYPIDDRQSIDTIIQLSQVRYDEDDDMVNNSDLSMLGVSYIRAVGDAGKSNFTSAIFVGEDDDTEDRIDGDRQILGLSLGTQHQWSESTMLYASIALQEHNYDAINGLFFDKRADTIIRSAFGMSSQFANYWSYDLKLGYDHSSSNIGLYNYDRAEIGVTVRRTLY